ncbi:MAG: ATP-grasp domain-containing protein [Candidatus Tectomicrobia bacterium]|uniref:ATP-grasp domain-containing protein n=1 Tax=Tectimicrobiota bacterium TaxID=2528274 RepID=A0A932LZ80_UNCTE|nr:ATP-grasp domain-containing protein [Candidatus Tectomicrobia bacterium]
MPRLLLLLPTTTYRTEAFLEAASRLGVEITVGCDRTQALAARQPSHNVTLDFLHPKEAARVAALFARKYPIDAVVGVDDDTAVVAAAISEALELPHNSVESTLAAKNKHLMREMLRRCGVPVPRFAVFSLEDDPGDLAGRMTYPCVLKPLILAASRGVIRADGDREFVAAFRRIEAMLRQPEVAERGEPARRILVENFIPGQEVALEGLLTDGKLQVLALFDKPDPLDGPFFEETIYVTPSRHPAAVQDEIVSCAARAAAALGLREGPVHAELRFNSQGIWMIEMAARSIGGLCSRILRFGAGLSLEDLLLRHALGMEIESMERERQPAGVMMLPIPQAGVLRQVSGKEEAEAVPGIVEVAITSHLGQELVPLPEGARYLGFVFARAETPDRVEAALREAQPRLHFTIEPSPVESTV